ncbi:MAG: hypothetical protein H7X88_09105 [Gloeobacteraceae cyanobacterium ES-bin-316]|nr:hypothetical protein [Ferruginibacter sp.]
MAKTELPHDPDGKDMRPQYADEPTQNRIQEHLNNENDLITEQDIANINTSIYHNDSLQSFTPLAAEPENTPTDSEGKHDAEQEVDKIKDNEDPEIETPWNILGS